MPLTHTERQRRYRLRNKDEIRRKSALYYAKNKEKRRIQRREYYIKNRDLILERGKRKLASLPPDSPKWAAIRKYKRDYARRNPQKGREWILNNPEKRRESARRYTNKRLSTPRGRLDHRMAVAVGRSLAGAKNGSPWEKLLGYTAGDLLSHIIARFSNGMTMVELMNGNIHIDHIIPKSKFSYATPTDPEFRRCWALDNLQPMWSNENLSKGAKIQSPAQIALGI